MSPCRTLEGLNGKMCELLHTSAVVQKMQRNAKRPQPPLLAGAVARTGRPIEIRPSGGCTRRAEHPLVALTSSGDLFISAKDLFMAAKEETPATRGYVPGRGPLALRCGNKPHRRAECGRSDPVLDFVRSR